MANSDHLVDKRIIDRNIAKGLLTKKDFAKHISDLTDMADNADYIDPEAPAAGEEEADAPVAEPTSEV